jgi:predicted chitinase
MANQLKALKNFAYPFRIIGAQSQALEPDDLYAYLGQWANVGDGFFILGNNGQFHGGIHFDQTTGGTLEQASGVRCIADGEVIAYRIDSDYPETKFAEGNGAYSTGFVLVRHRLQLPPAPKQANTPAPTTPAQTAAAPGNANANAAPANTTAPTTPEEPSLVFYSLYMHLRNWQSYAANPKGLVRPGFWESPENKRLVGDKTPNKRPDWGNPTEEQKKQIGINVRKTYNPPTSLPIGWLPRGTQITIGEIQKAPNGKPWGKIVALQGGEMVKNPGASPEAEAPLGWVYMDELSPLAPIPKKFDAVYVLPTPKPIAAKEIVGHLGEYLRLEDVESNKKERPLLHLEVFAGQELPAFIEKSRARDKQLDKSQKTLLKVEKGAILYLESGNPPNLKITPQHAFIEKAEGATKDSPWIRVEYGEVKEAKRGDLPKYVAPYYEGQGKPKSVYVKKLEGDKRAIFYPIAAWVKRTDLEKCSTAPESGTRIPKQAINAWSTCPLQLGSLCKLPDPARFTQVWEVKNLKHILTDEQGARWWLVDGVNIEKGGTMKGCARETGHPKVSLVSPWDWSGFEVLPYEELSVRDLFEWVLRNRTPESWEMLNKFYELIDTNKDRRLDRDELKRAWRQKHTAQPLSRFILERDSEWAVPISEWNTLDDLMSKFGATKDWVMEKQRIAKLLWWEHVKGKHEFPTSHRVYQLHPLAVIGNFGRLRTSVITVKLIEKVTEKTGAWFEGKGSTRSWFVNDYNQYCAHNKGLDKENFVNMLNDALERWGITELYHQAHFLSQIFHESAYFDTTLEYDNGNGYNPGVHPNAIGNGNTEQGDGPRYRGRGLIQLTWKNNYKAYGRYIGQDFVNNNNYWTIASNMYYAIDASCWFWRKNGGYKKKYKCNGDINVLIDHERDNVTQVTVAVNGGDNGLEGRKALYEKIKKELGLEPGVE